MATVQDFLTQSELAISAVVLPRPLAEIRWVASTELLVPGEFLEGGELVLTTGLIAKDWPHPDWEKYVSALKAIGVSALGFGVGVAFMDIPAALAQACEVNQVNLLKVEQQVTFVSISRKVAEMLMSSDERSRPQDDSGLMIQQELSRAAAKGSESAILRALASIFQGTAALHDPSGTMRLGPVGSQPEKFPFDEIRQEIHRFARKGKRGAVGVYEGGRHLSLVPLGLGGTPGGFLSLTYPEAPSPWQRSALSLAVSLLGVTAETERERRTVLRRTVQLLGRLLVLGEYVAAEIVAAEANIALPRHTQVVTCRVLGDGRGLSEGLDQHLWQSHRSRLSSVLTGWFWEEKTLIIVGKPGFVEELPTVFPDGCLMGIGSAYPTVTTNATYLEAQRALAFATPDSPRVHWDDLLTRSLGNLLSPALGREFAERQLESILDEPILIQTLVAFLQASGSITLMSRKLALHRNSAMNRLHRLRAILGADLDDPSIRAHLWIALELLGLDAGK